MAVLELNALSTALAGSFSATVIFPDNHSVSGDRLYPALYYLHDIGGNHTDIRTAKNLQELANELGVFLVAPSVMHSFGMDLPWGGKYGDFVCRELPGICRHLFPLDEKRQYIGGVGGGAYGAVWHAANHPDAFRKCFAYNGRFDVASLCEAAAAGAKVPQLTVPNLEAVFGELTAVRGSGLDVLHPGNPTPKSIFFGCTEDFEAIGDSMAFARQIKTAVHVGKTEEAVFAAALRFLVGEE